MFIQGWHYIKGAAFNQVNMVQILLQTHMKYACQYYYCYDCPHDQGHVIRPCLLFRDQQKPGYLDVGISEGWIPNPVQVLYKYVTPH